MKSETRFAIRLILMAIFGSVILMGSILGMVFTLLPSTNELEAPRNVAIICLTVAVLAAIGFIKLCIDVIRAHRRGDA